MKKLFPVIALFSYLLPAQAQNSKVAPLVGFLENQHRSAKEYVIDQFREKDIVIICERDHPEVTQYDLYMEIITDPYFIENVGAVYTEVGGDGVAPRVDALLMSEGLDCMQLRRAVTDILRDANNEPYLWRCPSWPTLITSLYTFNQSLPPNRKLHMFPVDHSIDWENIVTRKQFLELDQEIYDFRDSVMAYNFVRRYESMPARNGNKKALVIMNYRHAFLRHHHHSEDEPRENCAKYIHDVYGDRVASVMLNRLGMPETLFRQDVVQEGLWDAAFELADKTDVGFDLAGSPFGDAPCDLSPGTWSIDGYRYSDLFTGMIYYLPIDEHIMMYGWEGLLTEDFAGEFIRRLNLDIEDDEEETTEISLEFMEGFNKHEEFRYHDLPGLRAKIDRWKQ